MINKIENLLGEDINSKIISIVLGNNFPWFLLNTATPSDEKTNIKDINGNDFINALIFRHWFCIDSNINSNSYDLIEPVCYKIAEHLGKGIHLKSSAMNLLPPNEKLLNRYGLPHVDVRYDLDEYEKYDTYTGVYYINDADGDTVIYNESFYGRVPDNFTKNVTFSPKADTFVYWDSRRYHSAPSGCTTMRAILNLNFKVEK